MAEFQHDDLGAVLGRLLDLVIERERPILRFHELSMWEYIVLLQLRDGVTLDQTELSRRSRRDPTRLIAHLDALVERGLVEREVDATDRRRRRIRLTRSGRGVVRAVRRDIGEMEAELLGALSVEEQRRLRETLAAVLQHG